MENCDKPLNQAAALFCDKEIDHEAIEKATLDLLVAIGEDPNREGLKRTPERVSKMYDEILAGYRMDPTRFVNEALFNVQYDEMVIVRDIEFYSLCEHHLLPFIGRAHVAYFPGDKVIGLSKIPRIVDMFARRLQVQEKMTQQIANFLNNLLQPKGVAVVVEAMHLCSSIRGVKKHDSRMTTSAMLGYFRENMASRMEFLDNISRAAESLHF
jgi:GTP cyclohydrolase I